MISWKQMSAELPKPGMSHDAFETTTSAMCTSEPTPLTTAVVPAVARHY
jgi:hypothetical protein